MNSCILLAEIVQDPQLRYTSDTQTPITEMLVQFPGLRAEDPPETLKVVGWGNLAQEIQERYRQGDRVVIEGRLSMNSLERPEGFKEKRAELTVQRIHNWGESINMGSSAASFEQPSVTTTSPRSVVTPVAPPTAIDSGSGSSMPAKEPDYDDIPF